MKTEHLLTENIQDILRGRLISIHDEMGDEGIFVLDTMLGIMKESNIPVFKMWVKTLDEPEQFVPNHNQNDHYFLFFPRQPLVERQVQKIAVELYYNDFSNGGFWENFELPIPNNEDTLTRSEMRALIAQYIRVKKIS